MPANKGWECPKCGKVWSPHVDRCRDCNKPDGGAPVPTPVMPPYPKSPWKPQTIICRCNEIPMAITGCHVTSWTGSVTWSEP